MPPASDIAAAAQALVFDAVRLSDNCRWVSPKEGVHIACSHVLAVKDFIYRIGDDIHVLGLYFGVADCSLTFYERSYKPPKTRNHTVWDYGEPDFQDQVAQIVNATLAIYRHDLVQREKQLRHNALKSLNPSHRNKDDDSPPVRRRHL